MTVSDLLDRTSSAELGEWIAYFVLERQPNSEEKAETQLKRFFGGKGG